jgi:hypothetical protein
MSANAPGEEISLKKADNHRDLSRAPVVGERAPSAWRQAPGIDGFRDGSVGMRLSG